MAEIRAALGLCRARAGLLLGIAVGVTVPIGMAVLGIDLAAGGADGPALTVAQYALGALAYLLVAAIGLPALAGVGLRAALTTALAADRRRATLRALGGALVLVAAIRLSLSFGGATLLDRLAERGTTPYLVPFNAVHVLGKVLTAPFLTALIAVLYVDARRSPVTGCRGGPPPP